MKPYFIITLMLSTAFLNVTAQVNKPEEKSIVNKEFDEDGNLIKYDSTFVWSWNGDSAFQFDFPINGFFAGKDFPGFDEFMMDSVFSHHFNKQFFNFEPFENDDFFEQFGQQFPDSAFSQHFKFFGDSAFVFPFGSDNSFENFFQGDFEAMHKEMIRHFGNMPMGTPRFESEEQEKAWQELMQKQQKEKEELLKKWKEN
ncbi:MAG TPA: hypothetical protein DER09_05070 [Prolixibacteraceae bacterium]|nr:hypothetical protein [Prolixibacteraceae bacterium]